jgi:hypothetical protein
MPVAYPESARACAMVTSQRVNPSGPPVIGTVWVPVTVQPGDLVPCAQLSDEHSASSHQIQRPITGKPEVSWNRLQMSVLPLSALTCFTHALLWRPAPATFKPGSSTRECFRSSSEPLPRRHWPRGTTLTPARRTGGGLDGCPALPIANRNSESRTASFLSCACAAMADNSTRWRRPSSRDNEAI